jgi:hypothetical protein
MTRHVPAAAVRPTPVASFVSEPAEPAAGEAVRLLDLSYDPAGDGIALHAWDLGDGTTSVERRPTHRFARDGVYTVTLHVATQDGRVGIASISLTVATHDVALVRIDAPGLARVGEDAEIAVVVASRHRAEIVQVELLRGCDAAGWAFEAIQTRSVPALDDLEVAFPVTFDEADAEAGTVTFRARATLVGAADATPEDNELAAAPTRVTTWLEAG